jgi:hypothetical protein
MVSDIVNGTFKGFALLRQMNSQNAMRPVLAEATPPMPVYAPRYGLIPLSQVYTDPSTSVTNYSNLLPVPISQPPVFAPGYHENTAAQTMLGWQSFHTPRGSVDSSSALLAAHPPMLNQGQMAQMGQLNPMGGQLVYSPAPDSFPLEGMIGGISRAQLWSAAAGGSSSGLPSTWPLLSEAGGAAGHSGLADPHMTQVQALTGNPPGSMLQVMDASGRVYLYDPNSPY